MASAGPWPMTSGDRPVTAVETMRASGVRPSALAFVVAHDDDGGGAVVQRAGVAGGDQAVRAEDRLEAGHALDRDAGAGAVVLVDDGAVLQRVRRDLALPEAVGDGLLGAGSATGRRTRPCPRGRCSSRARRSRRSGPSRCRRRARWPSSRGSCHSVTPPASATVGALPGRRRRTGFLASAVVGHAGAEAGHGLDAGRDEGVALAGLDGVERHPGRLQRRRAVAVDGRAGQRSRSRASRRRRGPC